MNLIEDFEVFPPNKVDLQKCWINPSTLAQIGVKIASYITVRCVFHDTVCQVWPDSLVCMNSISYTKRVYKNRQDKTSGDENSSQICSGITSDSFFGKKLGIDFKCMTTVAAEQMGITLVVNDYRSIKHFKKDFVHYPGKLESLCKNLLYKFCFAEDYIITFEKIQLAELYGIYRIIINSCHNDEKHKYDGFIINNCTKVRIDNIISRERHIQKLNRKPVSIGGLEKEAEELCEILRIPFHCKSLLTGKMRKVLPKGILLRGPAGTGKTSLVRHVGEECNAYIITINGPEVFGSRPGETEENMNKILDKSLIFSEEGPTILFLDEVDALCPDKRNSDGEKEVNVSRLLMDFFDSIVGNNSIMVIGTTNRPMSLDAGLRRSGRFDKEIMINVPTISQRTDILQKVTASLPLSRDVKLNRLAYLTNGYVGADLVSVCREAAMMVLMKEDNTNKVNRIEMKHFESAVRKIMPSIKKGTTGLVELSPVDWSEIGGLADVKTKIRQAVEWPIQHPEAFQRMGLACPKGVLLYGPPGCCKTTLVRAAATATNATFITLSGAQLYSPYVGDSQRIISEVFQKARAAAPSIIFLDELDSIVGKRSDGSSNRGVSERVLSSLLNEMDGIGIKLDEKIHSTERVLEGESSRKVKDETYKVENRNVLLVAATNRPDLLDDALVRPGRIDRILYVPPPDKEARLEILKVYTKKMPTRDVDLQSIAGKTDFYTGADLQNLCREAALLALTDNLHANFVTMKHFQQAMLIVEPSLTESLITKYKEMLSKRQ